MANMFRRMTMQLMVGQRAERLHEEKIRSQESAVMRNELRSVRRDRAVTNKRLVPVLKQQGKWSQELAHEAHEHKVNLAVATCGKYRQEDSRSQKRLEKFVTNTDYCKEAIRMARLEIEDTRKAISEVEAHIRNIQKILAIRKEESRRLQVPRQEKVSRRLELACQELGVQLTENRALVADIRLLRQERATVSHLHDKMEAELKRMSKKLHSHVEVASEHFHQRDRTRNATAKLKEHFHKSTASFDQEMKNYTGKIDALKNLEKFYLEKNKHRLREREMAWLKQQQTPSEKDAMMYRQMGGKVCEKLKMRSMDEVVQTFAELVSENYMLFMNVHEARDDINDVQKKLLETREKISKMRASRHRQCSEARMRRKELNEKKEIYCEVADAIERRVHRADEIIHRYLAAVQHFLEKLGFTDAEILEMAGILRVIEPRNINVFLAAIERYVNSLWEIETFLEFQDYKRKKASLTRIDPVEARPPRLRLTSRLAVIAPTHEDRDDQEDTTVIRHSEEVENRAFSLGEIAQMVTDDLEARAESCTRLLQHPTMTDPTADAIAEEQPAETNLKVHVNWSDVF